MEKVKKILQIPVLSMIILTLLFLPTPAKASVPQLISYHGILKDASGNFLTGTYSMTFKLYEESTGGTALWTESQSSVSVSSGRFTAVLGSVTALNLDFTTNYWLGVKVGSDAEMTPRQRLTTVGYSYLAERVVNGFTQAQHDALSHTNIEGVKNNTTNIAKTNFKLDAYTLATANSFSDLLIDSFNDANGIDSGSSSSYTWRGASNYDVILSGGGIDSYAVTMIHANGTDGSTSFTDSSSSAHTVTANNQAQVDTAQSKFGGASSLYDGNDDYLSIPDHTDFTFSTGDFTIDFWMRFSSVSTNQVPIDIGDGDNSGIRIRYTASSTFRVYMNGTIYNFSWTPSTNTWYHVEVSRSGTNLRAFINGSQIGSTQTSSESIDPATEIRIGQNNDNSNSFNGWIEEVRISKGIARHTANFTVPDTEYTSSSGSATVISTAWTQAAAPSEAMVVVDQTLNTGSITYYVSRNNGTTWTAVTPEAVTSLTSQSSGTQVRWKAVISGNAELNAIAVSL